MKKLMIASITAMLLSCPIVSNATINNCKNIKFAVNNKTGATIKLMKVQYRIVNGGKIQQEGFRNVTCPTNTMCRTTVGQSLKSVNNLDLNEFEFKFQVLLAGTTQWSDPYRSKTFKVNSATCTANRAYGGSHWKIDLNPITPW